jgi:endogenous inhibitor of DNA gyrase (YacG/DUF329 family)
MMSQPPLAPCPTCGRQIPWRRDNPYRPFCSERCKLIDLGQWATEGYRIPDDPAAPHAMDEAQNPEA